MTDGHPTGDQQEADRTALSVPEAAQRLGVTPDAVRARLHRKTLLGVKGPDGQWRVFLEGDGRPTGTRQDSRQDATGPQQAPTGDRQDAAVGVDLAPLAEVITELQRENRDLAAAAALWQERARILGERLQALGAGDPTSATPVTEVAEASPWWRRWLGRR